MGKAVNDNEQDFDTKPLTIADVQEQTRIYLERISTNKISIAGIVREKRKTDPKMKMKRVDGKYTDEPVLDENGQAQFWEPKYYLNIAFEGGELDLPIEASWYNSLDVGNRALFDGHKGVKFGNVQDIYTHYTVL
ncbi:MAG: hypothetical protein RQ763_07930 [Sulfurimonas sp.]|uniref:hypothetical protein n=1 Tax=Sulfurimonas sp. TaxID=2022749 RepID=UPI0028CFC79C|nr:hypothetical protein [Sulfurimonas sp.]MDT8339113.1 hypothetical protein [Sulfurimonas sp.]